MNRQVLNRWRLTGTVRPTGMGEANQVGRGVPPSRIVEAGSDVLDRNRLTGTVRPAGMGWVAFARWGLASLMVLGSLFATTGCELRKKMYDQPRYKTYAESDFFDDGSSARPLVPGTVARGFLREDDHFYRGRANGEYVDRLPDRVELTRDLLARGQERYNIYCSVCHDPAGYGDGMVVQRGFKRPESYHTDRVRGLPDGYYFEVITGGFGMMPSYAYQIKPEDRWAIIAYIRTLQLSQHATWDDVPESVRDELRSGTL